MLLFVICGVTQGKRPRAVDGFSVAGCLASDLEWSAAREWILGGEDHEANLGRDALKPYQWFWKEVVVDAIRSHLKRKRH